MSALFSLICHTRQFDHIRSFVIWFSFTLFYLGCYVLSTPHLIAMESQITQNYADRDIPTILLVEDFDDTRLMMKMWLVRNGYRVVEAETGEEAISLAQRELPDLIIMDVMMPGMNGLDATQRIREYQALRRTPIVAVSAYGADEYRALAIDAGCNEYVSTPFDPNALAKLIQSLISKRGSSGINAPSDLEN